MTGQLEGKKAAVLVENLYQELEVWYPYYRLKEEGAHVMLVGTGSSSTYLSKVGYPAKVHQAVDAVNSDDLDAIVIPGGYAPDLLRRYPKVVGLVKEMFDKGKVVAAICHAGWVLVSAGVLKGKKATSFSAIKDDMVNAGAVFSDEPVVVDGNLITSRKPDDLPAFCRAIIEGLRE